MFPGCLIILLKIVFHRQKTHKISIQVKKAKVTKSNENIDGSKFEMYFDYTNLITYIKPHQILAINRGENLKILSVKIIVPDSLKFALKSFIQSQYMNNGIQYKERYDMFQSAFEEAFNKKCKF